MTTPIDSRQSHRRVGLTIVGSLVVLIVLVVGWSIVSGLTVRNAVDIVEAEIRVDGSLVIVVDSCNGDPAAAVIKEDGQQVQVEVVASSTAFGGGDDCLDAVEVALQEPLGERSLIDAHTGDQVEILRPGAD